MYKVDMVREVAHRTGYRQVDVAEVIDALMGLISEAIKRGEPVWVNPIGHFEVVSRPSRERFIPNIQQKRQSIPKYQLKFLPSVSIISALRQKYADDFPDDVTATNVPNLFEEKEGE